MLTDAQRRMLMEVQQSSNGEMFAPNPSTLRALKRRGLVTVHHIGMRYWRVRLTGAARAVLGEVELRVSPHDEGLTR